MVSQLKKSCSIVGKLYPVLIDENGKIIDGHHRLEADANWPKMIVKGIESEEQLLLARLITNVCRRDVSAAEKTEELQKLGLIYLNQGIPRNELISEISNKTGMSYRWVMKYIPNELKLRPGTGGPKNTKQTYEVAQRATQEKKLLAEPSQRVAKLAMYSNTNFATIMVEKNFFLKIRHIAAELGVDLDLIINNALLLAFQELVGLAKQSDPPNQHPPF